ncbi:MAG: SufD family Fe-S cluster assembly protein [Patescibacteria group bacterium]
MLTIAKAEERTIHLHATAGEEYIEILEQGSARVFVEGSGKLTLEIALAGSDASLEIIGRFEGRGEERQEVILRIIQQAPRTSAKVDFRAALRDASSSFFDGLIRVEEGAKDAKGFLSYRALLLSPGARAKPIPRLEVLTKEVASLGHAASVGKIDEEQMFYLQTRGLRREAAERLITDGFLAIPHTSQTEFGR